MNSQGSPGRSNTVRSPSTQGQLFAPETLLPPPAYELADAADRLIAGVVFNRPLNTPFDYDIPAMLRDLLQPGQRVRVPFGGGNRLVIGYCVSVRRPGPEDTHPRKTIAEVLDKAPLADSRLLELTRWIADHYLCGWGQVLDCIIPAGVKSQAGTREAVLFELSETAPVGPDAKRIPAKQQAILDVLKAAGRPMDAAEVTAAAGCGVSPLQTLRDKGYVTVLRERTATAREELASPFHQAGELTPLVLNGDQKLAIATILQSLRLSRAETFLLHGVTGSGKTEVYMRVIQEVVSFGKQAIVLVPEISLTPQTIRRIRSRFRRVAVLHSHLTDAERHAQWQSIASGDVPVIVGARSAVFAPCPRLGLIVIDEEHESSFKQDSTPRYHAREVARQRCLLEQIPLLLGTATPTLETWHRIHNRQDRRLSMPRRVNGLPLPPVVIVDIRNDPYIKQGQAIGRALATGIAKALSDGGQVILFLNVRGYAPVFWCRGCGEGVSCPECDLTLTWHKARNVALCHSCDYAIAPPSLCPKCNLASLRTFGLGTEKLEQEVQIRFPAAKCLRMDSDTMRGRGSHDAALEAFRSGAVQILLGTQMIAKGLDFPNVTLVGVIDADTLLHQPDLRASERTFQLLAQVAGRTGRSERGGRVLVQTSAPEQSAIRHAASHDFLAFAEEELQHRKEFLFPPYRSLIRVIVRSTVEAQALATADTMKQSLEGAIAQDNATLEVLVKGPNPCPVARLRGQYRFQLLLVGADLNRLRQLWQTTASTLRTPVDVEWVVDVEPINLR